MASSKRKDPASATASRVSVLEEEVRSLTEELNQCQADKEFVWSLWKHLQVANPDLTHAISLVVERTAEGSCPKATSKAATPWTATSFARPAARPGSKL